ncbi:hypothetical protein MTO96_046939 [Rhipicephalus appendiculatus]
MLVNTRCFCWSWRDESFVADSSLTASVEPLLRNSHRPVWRLIATDAARRFSTNTDTTSGKLDERSLH